MPTRTTLSPVPKTSKSATPIAFAKAVLRAFAKYKADPRQALAQAQIPPRLLHQPDGRITARQLEVFSSAAMQQLDDEALGCFSRKLPWGSLGMLCRASLTSPDLGVALKRWCRHHRLLTDEVRLRLTSVGALATISIEEPVDLGVMREFCLLTMLRNVHGYACWLIDSRVPLSAVTLPFSAPPHREVYSLLFPGPVEFGAPGAGFSFDSKYLAMPVRRDERALRSMLQRALLLTVKQYRRDRLLMQRVRELLRSGSGKPGNADSVARVLHLSTRSLHRHLRDEGTTLQQLKDEVRRDQAIEQLCRTRRPIKQIALAVGFGNEKAFSRAFKEWTGTTPTAYRGRRGGQEIRVVQP